MKKLLVTFACTCLVARLAAQDTHYWSQQFGTRSALLGGSIVAGTNDNTVIYYNPGALGFIDTGSISINANLYQIENIRILNAVGQKADFKGSQLGSVPLLVGGMLRNRNSPWKIGYGLISPVSFDFKATARLDGSYPVVDGAESPGNEDLIGQQDIAVKLSEITLGIGAGRKLNENWSIGFTGFFQVRSQTFSKSNLVRVYLNDEDNTLVSTTVLQQLNYYNVRFIPKFGLAYRKNGWAAGVTLTLPSLGMFGNGKVAGDATANNIKSNTTNERFDFVANDRQEKLKTRYKSPLSVAIGLSHTFNRSQVHFSAQYYGKVKEYNIIQAKPSAFARPADAYPDFTSDEFLRVRTAAKSVFNFAIGYEYALKPTVDLDFSFRNNQSFYDKNLLTERGIKPDLSSWDIYHATAGTTIKKGRSQMSVGLLYSFGSDNDRAQNGNLENPSEVNFLQGTTTIVKAKYSSIGMLLGFTFNFKKF